jgi:chromosomal replication initiation ATPase DnaA
MLRDSLKETIKDCEQAHYLVRHISNRSHSRSKLLSLGFSYVEIAELEKSFSESVGDLTTKEKAKRIASVISEHTGISTRSILSKNQSHKVRHARFITVYFCEYFNIANQKEIVKYFNMKSRKVVERSLNYVNDLKFKDSDFERLINKLEKECKQYLLTK